SDIDCARAKPWLTSALDAASEESYTTSPRLPSTCSIHAPKASAMPTPGWYARRRPATTAERNSVSGSTAARSSSVLLMAESRATVATGAGSAPGRGGREHGRGGG